MLSILWVGQVKDLILTLDAATAEPLQYIGTELVVVLEQFCPRPVAESC